MTAADVKDRQSRVNASIDRHRDLGDDAFFLGEHPTEIDVPVSRVVSVHVKPLLLRELFPTLWERARKLGVEQARELLPRPVLERVPQVHDDLPSARALKLVLSSQCGGWS